MVDAVIFDWAGTTVDYGSFAPVEAFMQTFREAGVEPTIDETRKPMGMLKVDHIRTMLKMDRIESEWIRVHGEAPTEADVQALYVPYEAKLLSILHNFATPKPFVVDAVAELRSEGVKIGSTTGYNNKMMQIVVPGAAKQGYAPDFWITPDSVGGKGRPFPYMIFHNLEALGVSDVRRAAKVGDTVADIKEGVAAGVFSIGVVEGSSVLALTENEYKALGVEERTAACARVEQTFRDAGADAVIRNFSELPALLRQIA